MKVVVIDVQGFYIPEFIVKELTIFDGHRTGHYLFKSPVPFRQLSADVKKQVKYLELNHHLLRYNSGNIDYENIYNILEENIIDDVIDIIYVKGSVKEDFLRQFFDSKDFYPRIINLEEANSCPKLQPQLPLCMHHYLKTKICICSLNNVRFIYNYVIQNLPK